MILSIYRGFPIETFDWSHQENVRLESFDRCEKIKAVTAVWPMVDGQTVPNLLSFSPIFTARTQHWSSVGRKNSLQNWLKYHQIESNCCPSTLTRYNLIKYNKYNGLRRHASYQLRVRAATKQLKLQPKWRQPASNSRFSPLFKMPNVDPGWISMNGKKQH